MIDSKRLEESDMAAIVDKLLAEHKQLPGTMLIVLALSELKCSPADYTEWDRQLRAYIASRIFTDCDILLSRMQA